MEQLDAQSIAETMQDVTLEPSIQTYVDLLRVLLPRSSAFNIYDEQGELLWSTRLSMSHQISGLVGRSLGNARSDPALPGLFQLIGSIPVYVFWLRRDGARVGDAPLATVAIRWSEGGQRDSCTFGVVHEIVRPALQCLRRDLLARDEIARVRATVQEQTRDIDLLKFVCGSGSSAASEADELKSILHQVTAHLQAGMAALIVPDKGIAAMNFADQADFDRGMLAKIHRHLLSMARSQRQPVAINRLALTPDEMCPYRVLACPINGPDGHPMGVFALFRAAAAPQFTDHHARLIELLASRISMIIVHDYDELSGLLTQPAFEKRMQARVTAADTPARCGWTALHVNVDHMHVINETHGMHIGDQIIRQVGQRIRSLVPPGALATRYCADQFRVLLPGTLEEAVKAAETLRQSIEQLSAAAGDSKQAVSISIGLAPVPALAKELPHILALAQLACKVGQARGANQIEVHQEADESLVRRMAELRLVAQLRAAINENRLQLSAQLIAPLGSQTGPARFEILLRMIDEKGKRVGPPRFMPAAYRHQVMPQIDRWVVGRTLQLLRPHRVLLAHNPIVFGINISGQSLADAHFAQDIKEMIVASGLNPAAICFELNENAMISGLLFAETFMKSMSKLGCKLALDNFGTGMSSLTYLRLLPVDTLKIDGSFVTDVLIDPKAASLIQSITHLAQSMSLVTVAKHIETEAVCARIRDLGVNYGQGFTIAAPEPAETVLKTLENYTSSAVLTKSYA